jgi:hypothetical protein
LAGERGNADLPRAVCANAVPAYARSMAATMASSIAFPIAAPFSLARHCTANIKLAATDSHRSGSPSHHYPSNEQSIFSYLGPIGSRLDAMTSQQRASLLDIRQTVGLDHIAFAVDPLGLRRIEPRTLLVNEKEQRAIPPQPPERWLARVPCPNPRQGSTRAVRVEGSEWLPRPLARPEPGHEHRQKLQD